MERVEERRLLAADLVISELMASNDSTLFDSQGRSADWIEVHNPTGADVGLGGWYLTDDPDNLRKWRFPEMSIEAGGYVHLFASGYANGTEEFQQVRDFIATPDATFQVDLPAGLYDVRMTLGDDGRVRDEMAVEIQAAVVSTLATAAGEHLTETYRAEVPAGEPLRVRWIDLGGATGRVAVNSMAIVPVAGGEALRFDFGTDRSAVAAGFVRVSDQDIYQPTTGYGWLAGAVLSSQDRRTESVSFQLNADGEYLALVRPDGSVAHAYAPAFPPQYTDVSYGIAADGLSIGFLAAATPGRANQILRSAPVQFSRSAGIFSEAFSLTLAADAPGTTIYYTTDNSTPTEQSPVYTEPLVIAETTRVRAIAVTPGRAASVPTSEWFVRIDPDLRGFTSNLPIVVLENFAGGQVNDRAFKFHAMSIFTPDPVTGRTSLFERPAVQTRAGLKIRGSSTARQPKKSFRLETWDARGMDQDIEPLGLPADSDWILYAPYTWDRTMLRNAFMYRLSNAIGRYAVRTRFVELYRNTGGGDLSADDYQGVYVLMETIKRGKQRVDVQRLRGTDNEEPEISGGWILKIDRPDPGETGFVGAGQNILYVDPDQESVTPEQAAWIKEYFDRLGASLADADPETGYPRLIDVDSWIDHHLLNVLSMNPDALRLSTYFHKRRDGKVEMGPIWDFDRSLESQDGRDDDPRRWSGSSDATAYFDYPWWKELFQSPDFRQAWADRWTELRRTVFADRQIEAMIDELAGELEEAEQRNFEIWSGVRPDGGRFAPSAMDTWRGEIVNMKNWLTRRMAWIDDQLLAPPAVSLAHHPFGRTSEVRLSAPAGTVYYTLDGSDPRAAGGGVRSGARAFDRSVTLLDGRSPARFRAAAAAAGDAGWQLPGFDDAAWPQVQAGIGYDTTAPDGSIGIDGVFTVTTARSGDPLTNLDAAAALLATGGPGVETTRTELPTLNLLDGRSDGRFDANRGFPNGGGDDFALRAVATLDVRAPGVYTFGINAADGARLRIDGKDVLVDDARHGPQDTLGTILLDAGPHDLELVSFERSGGAALELFYATGDARFDSSDFVLLGTSDDVPLAPHIESDTRQAMHGISAGAYLRVPFVAVDVERFASLALEIRYDDGFVAYLNGQEIARRNAPELLDADAAAIAPRGDRRAVVEEAIDVSSFLSQLREGENLLAIHALNAAADDPDFLMRPRLVGTSLGQPFVVPAGTTITARAKVAEQWSAPARRSVIPPGGPDDAGGLAVSEIHYNPGHPTLRELSVNGDLDNDDFEFVEVVNASDHPIDVGGIALSGGIDFVFPRGQGLLPPRRRLVVVRDRQAFEIRYGTDVPVAGVFDGGLNNRQDRLILTDRFGNVLQDFRYRDRDGWPREADGQGRSLEVIDLSGAYGDPANWRSSGEPGGSPGTAGRPDAAATDIVITELFAAERTVRLREAFDTDTAEVVSRRGAHAVRDGFLEVGPGTVDGGDAVATISSAGSLPEVFRLRASAAMDDQDARWQNAAIVFDYRGPTDFKFAQVDAQRDLWQIGERDADGWNFLSHFGETIDTRRSYDLTLDIDGSTATFFSGDRIVGFYDFQEPLGDGAVGVGSRGAGARFDSFQVEVAEGPVAFVELFNTSQQSVDIGGWQLAGDVRMVFPAHMVIGPGQSVVAVGFDPNESEVAAGFRERWAVSADVALVGPFFGGLGEPSGAIDLLRPVPGETGRGSVADRARYGPPRIARRSGDLLLDGSFNRVAADTPGELPTSWMTRTPTPGTVELIARGDANLDGEVGTADIEAFVLGLTEPLEYETEFGLLATHTADMDGDGDVDFDDIQAFVMRLE